MIRTVVTLSVFSCLIAAPVLALDPLAPRSERSRGMIYVLTPQPNDKVTITSRAGGTQSIPTNFVQWVPVGDYTVIAQMQDNRYTQHVTVQPTERTDVVVPGFGNIKVNSISPGDQVEVYRAKGGSLAAKFPASQIKTLPSGRYDVKITVGKDSVTKNNILIVTNTTRQVDVSYRDPVAPPR